MIKAVLFDLDNTLNHREKTIQKYAKLFLDDFQQSLVSGLELQEVADKIAFCDEGGYSGRSLRCERLLGLDIWLRKPTPEQLLEHWLNWVPKNPSAMPALEQTLVTLKKMGLALGIITNGSLFSQKSKIDRLGISGYFVQISISGEMGISKPDPLIFKETLKAMSMVPEETIFVGDHPINDIQGALDAKMIPVWFKGFHLWPDSMNQPQYVINELSEITEVVLRLNNETKLI